MPSLQISSYAQEWVCSMPGPVLIVFGQTSIQSIADAASRSSSCGNKFAVKNSPLRKCVLE